MATFRVYIKRRGISYWQWAETVAMVDTEGAALARAYDSWKVSDPSVPPLYECDNRVSLLYNNLSNAPIIPPGQQTFIDIIKKNISAFLGTQLDGDFEIISYPAGFNYGITYGNNGYYNQATLQDIDTMVYECGNGLLGITSERFSSYYEQILEATLFSLSQADKGIMQEEQNMATAQIASVLKEFENVGGKYTNPSPLGGKIQDIINQLITTYKSIDNLPDTLNGLRDAIANYKQHCEKSWILNQRYYTAKERLDAAKNHVKDSSLENEGMQVSDSKYYVGFTPNKLLTANQLINSLKNDNNKISININLYNFQSNSMEMNFSGNSNTIRIPIANILSFKINGSASYDLSKYIESSTNVTIDISYPGITLFRSTPSELSPNNSIGWYDNGILNEIVDKTGKDATGYQLQGSEYTLNETFGKGKTFSRVKTFVICQQPTIILTFEGGTANDIASDLQAQANVSLNVLGFEIGSAKGIYSVKDVKTNAQSNTVTVTLGPTKVVSGTIPIEEQLAYVLGGVASYPPKSI